MKIADKKTDALVGFKKARTSIESIIRMIEEDKYCVDIMQQNLAVIGLLKSAHEKLMNNHLETCFSEGMDSKSPTKKKKMIEEIERLVKMGNR
jgi:CsoR family transcriptional regulator, copper-sensing transcriptional repressor